MPVEVLKFNEPQSRRASLERASQMLADGALVAFPTETVYGLGCNAANDDAVQRLRKVKGRAGEQPFTVHVGTRGDAEPFLLDPPAVARRFMIKGWPGPLTLLIPTPDPTRLAAWKQLGDEGRNAIFSGGSVGLRFPDDSIAASLLAAAHCPVIASSANFTGRPPPVDAATIAEEMGNDVDLIIDGGRARYGKSSTIVSFDGGVYSIVREGIYDARTIRRLAMLNVLFVCSGNTCRSPMAEGLARTMLAEKLGCEADELMARGVHVMSCGTSAFGGSEVAEHAVTVCRSYGTDISKHRSQPLTPELAASADHIYAMTRHHLDTIMDLVPAAAERAMLLRPDGQDIDDPVGGDLADYQSCAESIKAALDIRLKEVQP